MLDGYLHFGIFPAPAAEILIGVFSAGQSLTVTRRLARKKERPDLEQVVGADEVWALCARTPPPGCRLFGRWYDKNVFIALRAWDKHRLAGHYPEASKDVIDEWTHEFGAQRCTVEISYRIMLVEWSMSWSKSDTKFVLAYERGMLRSAFKSLFWAIISEKKKRPKGFTLVKLAKDISTSKHEISRWFNGDPNWTVNTIASLANALDVDIRIEAIERKTGLVFTPAGVVQTSTASYPSTIIDPSVERTEFVRGIDVLANIVQVPRTSEPKLKASFFAMAA